MRPNAAYVGKLSHPIRLVMPVKPPVDLLRDPPLRVPDPAKFLTVDEALELVADLTSAIAKAIRSEHACASE